MSEQPRHGTHDGDVVVVHAYGIDEVVDEVVFMLLRQLAIGAGEPTRWTYVVFTDQPQAFDRFSGAPLRLEVVHLPTQRFLRWRGDVDYLHRVKIEVLRHAARRYTGTILYLDTDVVPVDDLGPVFDLIAGGTFVMDADDGPVDASVNRAYWRWDRFLRHRSWDVEGETVTIPTSTHMWIAGVIGFPAGSSRLLDDVLSLTDQFVGAGMREANCEQFAFSYVLSRHGRLADTSQWLYHYWALRGFSRLISGLLERYDGAPLDELVEASERLRPELLAPVKEAFDRSLPFRRLNARYPHRMQRVHRRMGRKWDIEKQFGHLLR